MKCFWYVVTRYWAFWISGIVLGLATFSWEMVLLGGPDDENRSPRPIVISPVDGETF